jgi:hypothetical protein
VDKTAIDKVQTKSLLYIYVANLKGQSESAEHVFVNVSGAQQLIPRRNRFRHPMKCGWPVRNPTCRTGPPGYIDWWNRFLGIDTWAP